MSLRLRAPAKLNLGLRLVARRADGYHEIETFFLPLRLCDELTLERGRPGGGVELEVEGAELPTGRDNLVVRAALETCGALGVPADLRIRLHKRIPVAAGLGGGSSSAPSARARARRRADVPFFLDPRPAFGRGIGDELEPVEGIPEMAWLLVAFPFGVATPWAFREASRELTLPRPRSSIAPLLGSGGPATSPPNDLEGVASRRHPEIRAARAALDRAGALITGMSGSGPTVYGRFPSMEEARSVARGLELPEGARAMAVGSPGSAAHVASADEPYWGVAKR